MTLTQSPQAGAKIGANIARIDGRLKVTGEARYASDMNVSAPAYGVLKTSAIARGRITGFDEKAARAVPGVLDIFTNRNVDTIGAGKFFASGGYMGSSIVPLAADKIWHGGQIVALVVADTFEAASEGADLLIVTYAADKPTATFGSPGAYSVPAADEVKDHEDPKVGDAEAAFAAAPVKIDGHYSTPTQHHNPIELFTTTCAWSGRKLTVWEPSQNVYGFKNGLADQLGIDVDDVHVISPYIGGAFGSRGSLTQRTAIVAVAAKRLNRPVKLVPTRMQGFTIATYRAETQQHVKLAAGTDGKLQSLSHEGWEVSSRPDPYKVGGTDASTRLYACPNVASKVSIVHADRSTPGFMRSPPELPYLFGLESAMDELAVALDMDPVELRRVNDTDKEPIRGLPYTSRSLMKCFDAAAKAFGWDRRSPKPGSMIDGDWAIGWGCASTMYPTQMAPATARVTISPQGNVKIQTAAHEIGNGAYTVLAIVAADRLGVPVDRIDVELGDSDLPPAPVAGGSNTTASVCNVVAMACEQLRARLAHGAVNDEHGPLSGVNPAYITLADGALRGPGGRSELLRDAVGRISNGPIEAYAENTPHGTKPGGMKALHNGISMISGGRS